MKASWSRRRTPPGPAASGAPSGGVTAAEFRGLRLSDVAGLLHDSWGLGVGNELLPAVGVPVEEDPNPVVLDRVAEHGRALGAMHCALLGALRRENLEEALVVFDLRGCQDHCRSPLCSGCVR